YDSIDISIQFTPQILELNSMHQSANADMIVMIQHWALPGIYAIDVEAYDGIVQHSSQIILTVTGQEFSISASPSRLDFPLAKNTTLNTLVTVTSVGGFFGNVNLTVSESSNYPFVPMLPSATPNSTIVTINPTTSASFQLAISVNSSLVAHQYDAEVVGRGATTNGGAHNFGITVVVGPDFNMSMQTKNLVVHQGSIGSTTLTFTGINGYSGTIGAYSGLISVNPPNPDIQLYPPGATLSPGGSNSSLLVVKTDGRTGLGTYYVAIEATDDAIVVGESLPYTITVEGPVAGPDFTMYASPAQISGSLGTDVNSTINVMGVGGYNGPVALYTSIGARARLSPASLALSSFVNTSSTFSMILPSPSPGGGGPGWWYSSGTGTVIVIAVDPAGLTHEASINITATPFSFVASLTRQEMRANSTATIGLFLGAIGGFNGTVAMTVTGSPGIIASLDNTLLNFSARPSSLESRAEVHVPAGTLDGDYLIQVTATYMRPERLPFSIAPKHALTYTLPFHVIVTSPTNPPKTIILELPSIEFYGAIAGLSAATAILVTYFALRKRTMNQRMALPG
ncbi:MAG TPA: hypothetical protein VFJ63_00775, partial [Candidatus Bathyarchaeia archaeon]|nr:hypothetical protein [Candidatus Bathyarchaeia archaeon]